MRRAAVLLAGLVLTAPVAAEDLVIQMSTQDVAITSTYSGARVTVFGLIERDASTISRTGKYDVVVTVAGPPMPLVVREKEQAGLFWINRTRQRFPDVPGYYALMSSGPVATIANDAARERQKMGLMHFLGRDAATREGEAAQALARLRKKADLLVEDARGVQMPRPNLFSAAVPLPASAPTGRYLVGVTVLADGVPLKSVNTSFVVRKIGFEAYIAAAARDHAWIYGLVTALAALIIGFAGNLALRRD